MSPIGRVFVLHASADAFVDGLVADLLVHRNAQQVFVRAQPHASLLVVRTRGGDERPEFRRVIEAFQVHQLVDEDVIAHPVGHRHEPPVQTDETGA